MSSLQSTLDALTIVDTLKACILKQDKVIRGQREEIESLKARITELEKDRSELNQTREQENPNNTTLTNVRPASPDENSRNTHDTTQETPERKQSAGDSTDNSEIFSTPQAPTSPVITITPENGSPIRLNTPQNSPGGTPVLGRRETFKSIKRSDSLSRQKQLSKKYELSPELQDRSVRFLERQYGGKEKAHQAARVIQLYYRNYRMDKQFKRIRSYSHTPGKDSFRQKSFSDPISQIASPKLQSPEGTQVTPVIRIKKRKSTDPRVKSILIIDNINSLSNGTSQMYSSIPSPPSDEKPASDQATSLSVEKENPVLERKELEPEKEEKEMQDEKEETRKQSSVSETEHYVKVELVDNLEGSPGDAFLEEKETGGKVPNGDVLRRPRRETFGEEGSVFESDESGDEMMGRGGLSSVDSLDGLCASGLVSTDDDSLSLCSEFEAGTKHQKLETRIGINHFNRKPEKGINYLVGHQVLDDNPEVVARFLLSEPGISKNKLGEYLGNLQNEFNMEVLKCFVQALDFTGMEVDEALRLYQTCFRLPGEAQKIEKLMQDFAEQYVASNPSDEDGAVDAILVLAFAIVMLNTDLHSPNVKRRMTEQDFINNLKGTNNGGDFPRESVLGIYNRIKKKSFVPGKDHVNVVEKLSKKIVGTKSPWTTLSALHRQLRVLTPLSNVRDPNKKEKPHPRVVFLFNDMLVATKERGRAGRVEGIHYYSYKVSFPLIGLKVSTFANDYYKCGIQVYSKLDSRILANFNARDEQTRKVFVDELLDCIEETNAMESDRITTEKQKHLGRFNRSGVDLSRASFTLPKKSKPPAPDTISLIDSASSMESLSTSSLMGTKQLSSSLLNINEGEFTTELKKSSSISSLDSAFAEGDSSRTTPEDLHGSQSMLNRRGLFGKWRQRHNTKSMGKPSPKLSPVPATRKNSTPA